MSTPTPGLQRGRDRGPAQKAAWLGFAFAILSALAFTGNTSSAVLAYQAGATPVSAITVRLIFAVAALYAFIRLTGGSVRLAPRDRNLSLALGLLIGLQSYTIFQAIELIPVALAILTLYLFPLMTGVAAHFVGQERMTWRLGGALAVAFIGLVLALDVTGDGFGAAGVAFAFAAAVLMVVIVLLSAPVVARIGDSRPVTFHMHISATVAFVTVSLILGELPLPTTGKGWTGFLAVPVFYTIAITAYFGAVRLIGPVKSGLVMNVEPVFSIIAGFLILGQVLAPFQMVGAAMVLVAILMVEIRLGSAKG